MTPSGVVDTFRAATGHDAEGVWSAPGRVNLIGEHTDYNDGFVLPFALEQRTAVAAARRDDDRLVIRSVQRPRDVVEVRLGRLSPGTPDGWAAYVAGVIWAFRAAGHPVGGMDIVVDGGVPTGSGLSSSAALECAVTVAAADLFGVSGTPADLARLAQHAENEFVGVPCGLMDQMAAMACTAGHVLFFDTRDGLSEQVPFDPHTAGLELLVVDTHLRHALADGAYAERRRSCEEAASRLGVDSLRGISPDRLGDALVALGDDPDDTLVRRVRHVVTENARVLAAATLLRAGRVTELGALMTRSHHSLRDDYEVSCAELDTAVEAALSAGALGARMTGGGFGGCAIVLAPAATTPAVRAAVRTAFGRRGYGEPAVWPATPAAGAHRETAPLTTATQGNAGRVPTP